MDLCLNWIDKDMHGVSLGLVSSGHGALPPPSTVRPCLHLVLSRCSFFSQDWLLNSFSESSINTDLAKMSSQKRYLLKDQEILLNTQEAETEGHKFTGQHGLYSECQVSLGCIGSGFNNNQNTTLPLPPTPQPPPPLPRSP